MSTLTARLAATAGRRPDAPALVDRGRRLTYGELLGAVGAAACALRAREVAPGDRVMIVLPNGPEFAAALFATAHVGGIAAPFHPGLTPRELASGRGACGARVVLTSAELRERCRAAQRLGAGPEAAVVDVGALPPRAPWPPERGQPGEPVLRLASSGSTGPPKAIERTHAHLLVEVDALAGALALSPDDRVLGVTPFSHVNGLVRSLLAALLSGAALVTLPAFERRAVARTLAGEAISVFIGTPFMFGALAEGHWPARPDLPALRLALSGSAPLRSATARRFRDAWGVPLGQVYGTTETGTVTVHRRPAPDEPPGTVGTPLAGVEVSVLSEDDRELPPGEPGRIAIRSPAAARAYVGDPAATARAFAGGRFLPGDTGRLDTEGRLCLLGRTSAFINRDGYKVDPIEVEEILAAHPKVRDVVVVGAPAPSGDETVTAVVVPAGPCTPAELIEHCRGALATFKIPGRIEFRAELPRSVTGKVLRRAVVVSECPAGGAEGDPPAPAGDPS